MAYHMSAHDAATPGMRATSQTSSAAPQPTKQPRASPAEKWSTVTRKATEIANRILKKNNNRMSEQQFVAKLKSILGKERSTAAVSLLKERFGKADADIVRGLTCVERLGNGDVVPASGEAASRSGGAQAAAADLEQTDGTMKKTKAKNARKPKVTGGSWRVFADSTAIIGLLSNPRSHHSS
jgi:hypothetical protein